MQCRNCDRGRMAHADAAAHEACEICNGQLEQVDMTRRVPADVDDTGLLQRLKAFVADGATTTTCCGNRIGPS